MLALALELTAPSADASSVSGEIALHADRGVSRHWPTAARSWRARPRSTAMPSRRPCPGSTSPPVRRAAAPETDVVNRRTADLLEAAGWSAAPERRPVPVTREIVTEDLDLPVRG